MLRIFRHYIPITLLLLGVAETLILLVSIYLGAVLGMALESPTLSPLHGADLPLWAKAIAFCLAMLAGMIAMGFYQRHGYTQAGALPSLLAADIDELIYWKRLR